MVSTTRGPPTPPFCMLMKPESSSRRKASRMVCRPTPNWLASSVSDGSLSPGFRMPLKMRRLISPEISSKALFGLMGRKSVEALPVVCRSKTPPDSRPLLTRLSLYVQHFRSEFDRNCLDRTVQPAGAAMPALVRILNGRDLRLLVEQNHIQRAVRVTGSAAFTYLQIYYGWHVSSYAQFVFKRIPSLSLRRFSSTYF